MGRPWVACSNTNPKPSFFKVGRKLVMFGPDQLKQRWSNLIEPQEVWCCWQSWNQVTWHCIVQQLSSNRETGSDKHCGGGRQSMVAGQLSLLNSLAISPWENVWLAIKISSYAQCAVDMLRSENSILLPTPTPPSTTYCPSWWTSLDSTWSLTPSWSSTTRRYPSPTWS